MIFGKGCGRLGTGSRKMVSEQSANPGAANGTDVFRETISVVAGIGEVIFFQRSISCDSFRAASFGLELNRFP
jgi:hypothetical protein